MNSIPQKTDTVPRYATLFYDIRADLDISWIEYIYLDMVWHLSHNGWCYKSLDSVGEDLGIDRSNVYRMRNRLIKKGLMVKNAKGHVKTSVTYAKRIQVQKPTYAKRNNPYAKRDYSVVKTHTKNNNRITKENTNHLVKEGSRGTYSPAKEAIRLALAKKDWKTLHA